MVFTPVIRIIRALGGGLLSTAFPDFCATCEEPAPGELRFGICPRCWISVEAVGDQVCAQCGDELGSPEPGKAWHDYKCGDCRARSRIPYDLSRSVCWYSPPLSQMIRMFKFEGFRSLARPLGKLLTDYCADRSYFQRMDVVVPVPISPLRHLLRGFNQSTLLAVAVAEMLQVPLRTDLLRRVKHRRPQSLQPLEKWKKNVRGAFGVRDECRGDRVLLVDDILTSAATVEECSRVLKRAGAESVTILTLARAEHGL